MLDRSVAFQMTRTSYYYSYSLRHITVEVATTPSQNEDGWRLFKTAFLKQLLGDPASESPQLQ